tara:strand:- start:944 stop:1144 length:201 start_codon:yes stop_codon:yes gene_type:complete
MKRYLDIKDELFDWLNHSFSMYSVYQEGVREVHMEELYQSFKARLLREILEEQKAGKVGIAPLDAL